MIDRVAPTLGRELYEVPVGFKWFVDGLLDGSLGFGGEESAGASLPAPRRHGLDDRQGRHRRGAARRGDDGARPAAIRASSTPMLTRSSARPVTSASTRRRRPRRRRRSRGSRRTHVTRRARRRADQRVLDDGAGQRRSDRRHQGRHGQRLVRRASVRHRGRLQDLRRELQGSGTPPPDPGGSAAHRHRGPRARGTGLRVLVSSRRSLAPVTCWRFMR